MGEVESAKVAFGQFQAFVSDNKLNDRQTLLKLNGHSSQNLDPTISKIHGLAQNVSPLDLKSPETEKSLPETGEEAVTTMSKHCAIPGCGKELPEGTKLPLCEYHRSRGKENGSKVAAGTVGIATLGGVIKKVGVKTIRKAGAGAIIAIRTIVKL